jgi:hypothetical protein
VLHEAGIAETPEAGVLDLKFATSFAANPEANVKSENHTRNIGLLASLSIPKLVRSLPQSVTSFGIETLAH